MIKNEDLCKGEILAIFRAVHSLSHASRMRVILSTLRDGYNLDEYELAAMEYMKEDIEGNIDLSDIRASVERELADAMATAQKAIAEAQSKTRDALNEKDAVAAELAETKAKLDRRNKRAKELYAELEIEKRKVENLNAELERVFKGLGKPVKPASAEEKQAFDSWKPAEDDFDSWEGTYVKNSAEPITPAEPGEESEETIDQPTTKYLDALPGNWIDREHAYLDYYPTATNKKPDWRDLIANRAHRILELNREAKRLTESVVEYKSRLDEQFATRTENENEIKSLYEERRALKDDVQRLRDDLAEATKARDHYRELSDSSLVQSLKSVIEGKDDAIERLQAEIRETLDENEGLKEGRDQLISENEELRAERDNHVDQIKALKERAEGYQQTIKHMQPFEDYSKVLGNRLAMAGFRFDYEKNMIIDRETGINLRKYVNKIVDENKELKAEIKRFPLFQSPNAGRFDSEPEYTDRQLQGKLNEANATIQELRDVNCDLRHEIKTKNETITENNDHAERMQELTDEQIAKLEKTIANKDKTIQELRWKANRLKDTKATILEQYDAISLQLKEYKEKAPITFENYNNLQEKHDTLSRANTSLRNVVDALKVENHQLKEHIEEFNPSALQTPLPGNQELADELDKSEKFDDAAPYAADVEPDPRSYEPDNQGNWMASGRHG